MSWITYLPDDILVKVDRTSMRHALEVRVPLLAREVVEFAFSVPEAVRFHGGLRKGLLRLALRDRLPAAVLGRRKRGFSPPATYREAALAGAATAGAAGPPRFRSLQERVLAELYGVAPPAAARPRRAAGAPHGRTD